MKINITSGEKLNKILKSKYPNACFVPFNEAMAKGGYTSNLFSDEFINERASIHGVSVNDYKEKTMPFFKLLDNLHQYEEITMWFGDEDFCKANRNFVLKALSQFGYKGALFLNIVNEYTGEIVSRSRVAI